MRSRWDYEKDRQLVELMFEHLTHEGIAQRMGESAVSVNSRISKLGLKTKSARASALNGGKPEHYLNTSPLYRKPVVLPLQSELPMDDLALLTMKASQLMDLAKEVLQMTYNLRKQKIEDVA